LYISSNKLDDTVSRAHIIARLEMALSRLEFALERTGKMPITYVSLLRRRKIIKRAYAEGTDLLEKHKLKLFALLSTLMSWTLTPKNTESWCCNAAFSDSMLLFIYLNYLLPN